MCFREEGTQLWQMNEHRSLYRIATQVGRWPATNLLAVWSPLLCRNFFSTVDHVFDILAQGVKLVGRNHIWQDIVPLFGEFLSIDLHSIFLKGVFWVLSLTPASN